MNLLKSISVSSKFIGAFGFIMGLAKKLWDRDEKHQKEIINILE